MKPTTSASQVSLEHRSSATAAFKHNEAFLQGPTTNLFISDEKQHPEEVAQIPTLATPPNFPSSEDKQQRGCLAAMSSQTFSLRNPTMCPPETTLKLDEITATEGFSAGATFKVDGAKDGQTSHTIPPEAILKIEGAKLAQIGDATSDPNDVEATLASFVVDEDYSGPAISHDEALAFLNCEPDMTDEEIIRHFSRKNWDYPNVANLARHAVKAIALECDSIALLNWLITGSLEDPEQIGDKTERLPEISYPFWWRIENVGA